MKKSQGYGIKPTWETRLRTWLLSAYARSIWQTARYVVAGERHIRPDGSGRGSLVVSWHGFTLAGMGHYVASTAPDRVALVSDDRKGWVVGLWLRTLGFQACPISGRTRSLAAGRRLMELVRQVRNGANLLMNPDGPYGPPRIPKEGLLWLARKTGARIVPVGAYTGTACRLPRWDRYLLPLPFSRIGVCYGSPFEIASIPDPREALARIRSAIDAAISRARQLYYQGR
ncbi:MAG: DUF374 domain-containing protein [Spirochaetales bacterium]|nr:DUF374 domain-containing protein [Spirochaetales bacterium]